MDETQNQPTIPPNQLKQQRVPLHEADDAFARPDENGRTPIIVTPQRLYRFLNPLVVAAIVVLLAALFGGFVLGAAWALIAGLVVAAALLVPGVIRWFYVQIPEGVN